MLEAGAHEGRGYTKYKIKRRYKIFWIDTKKIGDPLTFENYKSRVENGKLHLKVTKNCENVPRLHYFFKFSD